MKTTKWLALLVAVVVLVAGRDATGASSRSPKKKAAQPKPAEPRVEVKMELVAGYGETAEKAKARAAENARDRAVTLALEAIAPDWVVPESQLKPEALLKLGVIQPEGEAVDAPPEAEAKMVAYYKVGLTPDFLKEVAKANREVRRQDRHVVLARVMFGILAVALVTAGYLRVEEMTRGYATKLLRLAVVVILALVGAGLFLTR